MTYETENEKSIEKPQATVAQRARLPLQLGAVYQTPGAAKLNGLDVLAAIGRHARGDWGDLCTDDWTLNNKALVDDSRILSSYVTRDGVKFWIITEWDRSATTILLPDEY